MKDDNQRDSSLMRIGSNNLMRLNSSLSITNKILNQIGNRRRQFYLPFITYHSAEQFCMIEVFTKTLVPNHKYHTLRDASAYVNNVLIASEYIPKENFSWKVVETDLYFNGRLVHDFGSCLPEIVNGFRFVFEDFGIAEISVFDGCDSCFFGGYIDTNGFHYTNLSYNIF